MPVRNESPLNPNARSQNWQKKSDNDGRKKIWKGSWYRSLLWQMVLRPGKTLQRKSWKYEQKGGRTAGESSGLPTRVGSYPSFKQVQQAGFHLYCQRTLQGLPVVQLTLLKRRVFINYCADLRVEIIYLILQSTKPHNTPAFVTQQSIMQLAVPFSQANIIKILIIYKILI